MSMTVTFKWVCHGPSDCPGCAALNGQVHALDEWNIFPGFHPHCDCTLEPVYTYVDDGYYVQPVSVQFVYPIWHIGPQAQQLYQYQQACAPTQLLTSIQAEIVCSIQALLPHAYPPEMFPVNAPPNVTPPSSPYNPPKPYVEGSDKRFG